MDVMNIKYPDNFFDIVIDKSTIDVMFCGELSSLNIAIMMKEVQRVLKKKKFILLFHSDVQKVERYILNENIYRLK